jgi:nucleoside-triphosphatase
MCPDDRSEGRQEQSLKRLFLTGPIGCGKSTLIRTVLGDSFRVAGGFITERVLEGEELVGFDIVSLGGSINQKLFQLDLTDPEWRKNDRHLRVRFLSFKGREIKRNDEAFSVFASALLLEACKKPFAIMDEIGGFEILIPEFMEALELFLQSRVPCVGVLKSLPSSEKLSEAAGLGSQYLKAAKHLHLCLASDPETDIVKLSGHEDIHALNTLRQWKEQYL